MSNISRNDIPQAVLYSYLGTDSKDQVDCCPSLGSLLCGYFLSLHLINDRHWLQRLTSCSGR